MAQVHKTPLPFVKLYVQRMTSSSIWEEPAETRLLFIWLLGHADVDGCVLHHSPTTLARLVNISLEGVERGLATLEAPDPQSRTRDEDGRRLILLPNGGWKVVNIQLYREMQTAKQAQDAARKAKSRNGRKQKPKQDRSVSSFDSTHEVGGRHGWDKPD